MSFDRDQYQKDVVKELMAIRKNLEVIAKAAMSLESAETDRRFQKLLDDFAKNTYMSRVVAAAGNCESGLFDRIIAVDFDGTLVTNAWPDIGEPILPVINYVKCCQQNGARLILWTNRSGAPLEEAVRWCEENCIVLSAVNENLPEIIEAFGGDCRKIFAHEYLDDRAVLPEQVITL